MRATLHAEVAAFLREHGPSTGKQIALAIRARRADVDLVLASDDFERAPRPEGAHPYTVHYVVSRRVPSRRSGASGRADRLYRLLADGRSHPRWECRQVAGDYTNNAAKELRDRGHVVRYDRKTDSYTLVVPAKPEALPPSDVSPDPTVSGFADSTAGRSAA